MLSLQTVSSLVTTRRRLCRSFVEAFVVQAFWQEMLLACSMPVRHWFDLVLSIPKVAWAIKEVGGMPMTIYEGFAELERCGWSGSKPAAGLTFTESVSCCSDNELSDRMPKPAA